MRIIKRKTLTAFYEKHADAETEMEEWYRKMQKAQWNNFSDVKRTFNTVSSVGNQRYVFDIKGNNYRIVTIIKFQIKMVYIRFVGTHPEYDKIESKIKNL